MTRTDTGFQLDGLWHKALQIFAHTMWLNCTIFKKYIRCHTDNLQYIEALYNQLFSIYLTETLITTQSVVICLQVSSHSIVLVYLGVF